MDLLSLQVVKGTAAPTAQNRAQPSRKRIRDLETWQAAERLEQSLLSNILCQVEIADMRIGVGHGGILEPPNEVIECPCIAALSGSHQFCHVVSHFVCACSREPEGALIIKSADFGSIGAGFNSYFASDHPVSWRSLGSNVPGGGV